MVSLYSYIHPDSIEIRRRNTRHECFFSVELRLNGDVYGRIMFAFRHLYMYTVGGRRLGSHTFTSTQNLCLFCCLYKTVVRTVNF